MVMFSHYELMSTALHCFRHLYKVLFSTISVLICLFIQEGCLPLQVIVSCGIKFSIMFIVVLSKTETCLFTSRLERLRSQSNNSIASLIRLVLAC